MIDPSHVISVCCLVGVSLRFFGSSSFVGDLKLAAALIAAALSLWFAARLGGIPPKKRRLCRRPLMITAIGAGTSLVRSHL